MVREKMIALSISLIAGGALWLGVVYGLDATHEAIQEDLSVAALEAGSFSDAPQTDIDGGAATLTDLLRVSLRL